MIQYQPVVLFVAMVILFLMIQAHVRSSTPSTPSIPSTLSTSALESFVVTNEANEANAGNAGNAAKTNKALAKSAPDEPTPITLSILGLSPVSASWDKDTIPKIIHQTAPKDDSKWHHIWKECQNTWFEHFEDFEYKMWTDEDIQNLIQYRFKNFYPIWKAYPENIHRIDAVRYFILYEYGGIYVDMDYECVQNFYDLLPHGKASIAESAIPNEEFQNALMASPPKHPFWHYVLNEIIAYQHVDDVLDATGPNVIARVASVVPDSMLNRLQENKFAVQSDPNAFREFKRSLRQDIYAIHHGSCVYCK
jgi:mannosyltransferase OCH1-like enzyme